MSIFKILRAESNSLMKLVRLMNYLYLKKFIFLSSFVMKFIRVVYACEIPAGTVIGNGVLFLHNGLGVVVHPDTVIGDDTKIYQNVSLAGRNNRGAPVIGKRVFIGAGACVLGGITIGDDVIIGANSVVISDIPEKSTVVGIPGKVIKVNM